jgi:hypothetical protein
MLSVQKLKCKDKWQHPPCKWVTAHYHYQDTQYLLLKQRLSHEVKKSKIAYRILHHKFGVLCTLKMGHDGELFVSDNLGALRMFALY